MIMEGVKYELTSHTTIIHFKVMRIVEAVGVLVRSRICIPKTYCSSVGFATCLIEG